MKRGRWVPRGGYAPTAFLTPRDARRVYYVMRNWGSKWVGIESIVRSVRRYEQTNGYARIGPYRTRRAVHWLVEEGFVEREEPKPFTPHASKVRKTYVVPDPKKKLPDDVPAHEPRRHRRKHGGC